jgi:hypothetical protein
MRGGGAVGLTARRPLAPKVDFVRNAKREGLIRSKVCHCTTQPLAELCGGCVVVLKVSWCGPAPR